MQQDLRIVPKTSLDPMPERPTLFDFFRLRFSRRRPELPFAPAPHMVQSALRALRSGAPEETVLACLLHDVGLALISPDHGWWGAQLVEPYVSERVAWAIRHHQALRFFPDPEVGYEYPPSYRKIFGEDYVPEPYLQATYAEARAHRWYMDARLVTLNDEYAFDPQAEVSLEPLADIVGRHFRAPREGLGFDGSPVAHMWRSIIWPGRPL
ncbi:MAG: HD domain-containing protein [Myxococcales bacterium]